MSGRAEQKRRAFHVSEAVRRVERQRDEAVALLRQLPIGKYGLPLLIRGCATRANTSFRSCADAEEQRLALSDPDAFKPYGPCEACKLLAAIDVYLAGEAK